MKKVLALLSSALLLAWQNPLGAAPNSTCQGKNIRKIFPSGALWDICWTIADKEGLSLSQVHFKAPNGQYRRILGEASLSQVQTIFDNRTNSPVFITTQMGLGAKNTQALYAKNCQNGELHAENKKKILCARTVHKGYMYKYNFQRQTEAFELISHSQVGLRSYQLRWTFYENGTIEPAIGFSGILSEKKENDQQRNRLNGQNDKTLTSFTDHYLWRLDFDLDTTHNDDSVQEINSIPYKNRTRKYKTINTLQTESARQLNPEHKTFWCIVDGNTSRSDIGPASYEIVPSHHDQSGANSFNQNWLKNDLYFTHYNRCERNMADNSTEDCKDNVADFIEDHQNIHQADIVAWYKQNNHYLPRSENPFRMTVQWNSFTLIPRDWNTQNPY